MRHAITWSIQLSGMPHNGAIGIPHVIDKNTRAVFFEKSTMAATVLLRDIVSLRLLA
jgi:hypothetical protein